MVKIKKARVRNSGEKSAAWEVTNVMKEKRKFREGIKKEVVNRKIQKCIMNNNNKNKICGKGLYLRP